MATFEELETGKIGLVTQKPDGRIVQIGLTREQSSMLQYFLASLSKESPLIELGEEYDLQIKNSRI